MLRNFTACDSLLKIRQNIMGHWCCCGYGGWNAAYCMVIEGPQIVMKHYMNKQWFQVTHNSDTIGNVTNSYLEISLNISKTDSAALRIYGDPLFHFVNSKCSPSIGTKRNLVSWYKLITGAGRRPIFPSKLIAKNNRISIAVYTQRNREKER